MAATSIPATPLRAGTWVVDPEHTTLEFRVKHVGLARVRGVFHRFEGVLEVADDGALTATGSVEAASLDTRVGMRDEHLRSADFFDVEHHPQITFATTMVQSTGPDRLRIAGDLTIRGTTRRIELDAEVLGTAVDDEGAERIGLEATGRLDRRDFGLNWNSAIEGGGILVGHRVDLQLDVSAVRRA